MPRITFVKEKKTIDVEEGANLRKEALKVGIELYPGIHKYLNCRGLGQCASCRVIVRKGVEKCSPPTLIEKLRFLTGPLLFFARIGQEQNLRLACQLKVYGDIEVETQPPLLRPSENFWS